MVSSPLTLMVCPGIVAALKADNDPTLGAEHIHNLALALVSPLRADDDRVCH